MAILATALALFVQGWVAAAVVAGVAALALAGLWWRGTCRAAEAVAVVDGCAAKLGLLPCGPEDSREQGQGGAI